MIFIMLDVLVYDDEALFVYSNSKLVISAPIRFYIYMKIYYFTCVATIEPNANKKKGGGINSHIFITKRFYNTNNNAENN